MKKIFIAISIVLGIVVLSACEEDSGTQSRAQKLTEQAFEQQEKAVPYPVEQLKDSLERKNLKERLLRTNKANKIGYVYLMSFGKMYGYYVIKGKVSSNQSQMTASELIVDSCGTSVCTNVVTAPGDDGSYGENENGIFFFTTDGTLVVTNSEYNYADQPLNVDVPLLRNK